MQTEAVVAVARYFDTRVFVRCKFDIFISRLYIYKKKKKTEREKQSAYLFYWAVNSPF